MTTLPNTYNDSLKAYEDYLEQNCLMENQTNLSTVPSAERIIPEWLFERVDTRVARPLTPLERDLLYLTFENIFDYVLEMIAGGVKLEEITGKDPRVINKGRFIQWILSDETRKQRYYEAQAIFAEIDFDRLDEIAEADDSIEDVGRSTLRINTKKYKMSVINRKRFGDVKQIEQSVSLDIAGAMERAEQRVIDITPVGDNG